MKLIEHHYYFKDAQLDAYVQIVNKIKLDKRGYIESDTVKISGSNTRTSKNFDHELLSTAIGIAKRVNPCLKLENN
jgi:hypothetical protein